jgi:hypothetical protein
MLRDERLIAEEPLQDAIDERARTGEPLAVILHQRRFLDEVVIARLLVKHSHLPYVPASEYGIDPRIHHERPELCRDHVAVLDRIGRALLIAVCDIPSRAAINQLEAELEAQSFFVASTVSAIAEAHARTRQRTPGTGNHLDRARLWGVASDSHNPPIDLTRVRSEPEALALLNQELARYYGVLPLSLMGALTVAVENPFDILKLDDVATLVNHSVRVTVALDVQSHIARSYEGITT